jgi:hyperosmotically inducible protein
MNASLIRKTILSAALVAGVAALPITTVSAQDSMSKEKSNQTVPDKAADGWITTKVKSELASTKGIKSTDISVDTNDGVVTLSGTTDTAASKTKAEHVAKKVKGVKSVSADGLTVGESK